MEESDFIIGLFFVDEQNSLYKHIKYPENIKRKKKKQLKKLPLKYFNPDFLKISGEEDAKWKIEVIETLLSQKYGTIIDSIGLQSFFYLNSSSINEADEESNLFIIVGSPYTEEINMIYRRMADYIHPRMIQHRYYTQKTLEKKVKPSKFYEEEIPRGFNFIEYSLGSARKMYWQKPKKYYCVGLIERINSWDSSVKETNIYTFAKESPLRSKFLDKIPSYRAMTLIQTYYEMLINETLDIFDKSKIISNISRIELSYQGKEVTYFEEFTERDGIKTSYGVVLIPEIEAIPEGKNKAYYKKHIRLILDGLKKPDEVLSKINPCFSIEKWSAISDEDLEKIRAQLDDLTELEEQHEEEA